MNLADTIRSSTIGHGNLLVVLDQEVTGETDVFRAFMDWIEHNPDGLVALPSIVTTKLDVLFEHFFIVYNTGFMFVTWTISLKSSTNWWSTYTTMDVGRTKFSTVF